MILKPEAEQDIAEAIQWYEEQRAGLGVEFQAVLDKMFEQIERMPRLHPMIYQRVHLALTPRFPFAVYYRVEEDEVIVFAVVHVSRDPKHWKSRL